MIIIFKNLMKDQKGAAGIDTYFNLAIVMMFLVIFMVALTGIMTIFDSRSDLQNIGEFIGQQYRDEGCISSETRDLVIQMAQQQKMDVYALRVDGEDMTPLKYRDSKIITVTYGMQIQVFPHVRIQQSITLPVPIVSQYVQSPLLVRSFSCVAM